MFGKEAAGTTKHVCVYTHSKQKKRRKKKREFENAVTSELVEMWQIVNKKREGKIWKWNMVSKNYMNVPTKKSKNPPEMKMVTLIVIKNHS